MKKEEQAKGIWRHLIRKEVLCETINLGGKEVLTVTKDVAMCILANPGIILEDIIRDPYFSKLGRSTVKRAVSYLYKNGFIKMTTSNKDKRANLLYFKQVD